MKCIVCGRVIFDKWRSVHPHRARKYCSLKCRFKEGRPALSGQRSHLWKNAKVEMQCHLCGSKFVNYPSNKKHYKHVFCSRKCANRWIGRYHATPRLELKRKSKQYKLFKERVLLRDGRKCLWCGTTENLQVDHIKPYATHPRLRMSVSNGRTLCHPCHKKTDTYGVKAVYQ